MRLRMTAEPQLFETTNPSRGGPARPDELTTTIPPLRRRVPLDRTLRKSRELRRESGSETFPALGATILDRCSSGASAHPMTETVTSLSAANFWLIGPFHAKYKRGRGVTQTGYGTPASSAIWMGSRPSGGRRSYRIERVAKTETSGEHGKPASDRRLLWRGSKSTPIQLDPDALNQRLASRTVRQALARSSAAI